MPHAVAPERDHPHKYKHWATVLLRTPFMLQPSGPEFASDHVEAQPQLVPTASPDMGDMRAHDVALSHLNARGFIQFHPVLAQQLDDFKAAIFLGHALYWSKHLAQIQPHRKGWFFMSAAQWTQATGLSTREQVSVRAALTSRGILREALAGRPAVLHFKVDLETTAKLLGQPQLTWTSMTELFRACIRFYKPLADICGSVGAGLYLSYLLQRQSFALRNPPAEGSPVELFPGEFVYRPEQARITLCLGSKAQRNAREKLKAAGFIKEGRASHEVVATRVNLAAIASCLQAQGERTIRKSRPRKRPALDTPPELGLVPAKQLGASASGAALLRRGDAKLPQRQLNLFTPVGLISKWPLDRGADDRLAPQDDAASLSQPSSTSVATPANLVMSLFAPGVAQPGQLEGAAGTAATPSEAKLSTDLDTSSNHPALLSNAIRPFVDPNLPFCRNYKEQGISRYFQTTTTATVDNLDEVRPGRRRIENSKIQKPETAVDQKTHATAANQAPGGVLKTTSMGGSQTGKKSLVGPEIKRSQNSAAVQEPAGLVMPDLLDNSLHAGVLAALARAPLDLRQSFLDELAGHLAIPNKTIHNPAGWLHSLIQRHATGFVTLTMAAQVATLRQRKRQHQERMALVSAAQKQDAASDDRSRPDEMPVESEVKKTHRLRLQELREQFVQSQQGGRK